MEGGVWAVGRGLATDHMLHWRLRQLQLKGMLHSAVDTTACLLCCWQGPRRRDVTPFALTCAASTRAPLTQPSLHDAPLHAGACRHLTTLYAYITKMSFSGLNQPALQVTVSNSESGTIEAFDVDYAAASPFELANRLWAVV
jgi:hypothetical protein